MERLPGSATNPLTAGHDATAGTALVEVLAVDDGVPAGSEELGASVVVLDRAGAPSPLDVGGVEEHAATSVARRMIPGSMRRRPRKGRLNTGLEPPTPMTEGLPSPARKLPGWTRLTTESVPAGLSD